MSKLTRRQLLASIASGFGVSVGATFLPSWVVGSQVHSATPSSSYLLKNKDKNGLMLLRGFRSRIVAESGERPSPNSNYEWHPLPDGGAVFRTPKKGWIYVSNSEVGDRGGGVGALVFDRNAKVIDAYSICKRTSRNCSGGPTPWNTWLTCEETSEGFVWECDPFGRKAPRRHTAMGRFYHEAAVVDSRTFIAYMTEDHGNGGFYRFIPKRKSKTKADYSKGTLQVARLANGNKLDWVRVPEPLAHPKIGSKALMERGSNKKVDYTTFNRGEGACYHKGPGKVLFATTGDNTIWTYDTSTRYLHKVYEGGGSLTQPDNLTVLNRGLILVAEDAGNLEIVGISQKTGKVFPIVRMIGHGGSEVTGPAFDPSGRRLYFSSQRGKDGRGITFEVSGPFYKYV